MWVFFLIQASPPEPGGSTEGEGQPLQIAASREAFQGPNDEYSSGNLQRGRRARHINGEYRGKPAAQPSYLVVDTFGEETSRATNRQGPYRYGP